MPQWRPLHRHATIFYFSKSSQGPSLGCLASQAVAALTLKVNGPMILFSLHEFCRLLEIVSSEFEIDLVKLQMHKIQEYRDM
jgi:hypothetical protein